jgi:hypothetical protein
VYLSGSGTGGASEGHLIEEMHPSANRAVGVCIEGGNSIVRSCHIAATGGSALAGYNEPAGISFSGEANRVLNCDISDVSVSGTGILFASGADNFAIGNRLVGPAAYGIYYNASAAGKFRKNLAGANIADAYLGGTDAGENMVDSNDNGILDAWEMEHFGDLSHTNPVEDFDGDGLTNLQESQQGSAPNDFFNGHAPVLSASAISLTQANLFWSLDGVNLASLQGWNLERKAEGESAEAYTEIAGITGGTVRAFIDEAGAAQVGYTYRLRAFKPGAMGGSGNGYSLYSNEASVAAAQGTVAASLPLDDLLLWLKADAGVNVDPATGVVLSWTDASGHGLNASAPASANRPQRVSAAVNNQPAVRFDGANSFLSLPAGFEDFDAGLTVLSVAKPTGAPAFYQRFFDFGNGAGVNNLILCREATSSNLLYISMSADGQWITSLDAPAAIVQDSFQLLEATQGATGAGATIHKNGVLAVQGTAAAIPHVLRTSNFIGHSNWPSDPFPAEDIAEMLIFNRALSDAERGQIEDYLNLKYNLGMASADADHDGLPDDWEMQYFGHTGVDPNALAARGDGLTNLQAFQQGLNPNDFYNAKTPALAKLSGDNQTGPPGGFVPAPLVVQVSNSNGQPVMNGPVTFTVSQGGGTVQKSSNGPPGASITVLTDSGGQAKVFFKLPNAQSNTNTIVATPGSGTYSVTVAFTEYSDDGNGSYNSPFAPSNIVSTLNPDGSGTVTWTNNTDADDQNLINIREMDANGNWHIIATVPPNSTSYQFSAR